MGNFLQKQNDLPNYDLMEDSEVTVNFIQIRPKSNSTVSIEQFNVLLGLDIPKYSILENSVYPYVLCISTSIDIKKICSEYNFEIGIKTIQKIHKNEYNSKHIAIRTVEGYELRIKY
jgi:hypothetical protein